jgi:hypothetical protein
MKKNKSESIMWMLTVFVLMQLPFGWTAWNRITSDPSIKYAVSDESVMVICFMMMSLGVMVQYHIIKDYLSK